MAGVRPFKRSVVIHSSYCSAPITAPPVLDVLGSWTTYRLDGGAPSFSPVIGNRFTERVVIAARHAVSVRVQHAAPGRFVLAVPPGLDIYCRFIADCAERTSAALPGSACVDTQPLDGQPRRPSVRPSCIVTVGRPTERRHGFRVLW